MKILVMDGPNVNLTGFREPEIYGSREYSELIKRLEIIAAQMDVELDHRQSNHEGDIIDSIHEKGFDGIIINPAGYTHTSVAISDAINAVNIPVIEVHLTNIHSRTERSHSLTARGCEGVIAGFGFDSYVMALEQLVRLSGQKQGDR